MSFLRRPGAPLVFLLHTIVVLPAAALVVWALSVDSVWFDRHVLPNYCPRASSTLVLEKVARWTALAAGLAWTAFARPKIVRSLARPPSGTFFRASARIAVAVVLALGVSDLYLRIKERRRNLEHEARLPPMRCDETRNYVAIPSRANEWEVEGRAIRYEINAEGNRAASIFELPDHDAPSILFTGESIALGLGVAYPQSYPARVAHAIGIQAVNLAVTGSPSDQAYLRLRETLPTFSRPVAVVTLVLPDQLERNVSDRRQRLVQRDGRLELAAESIWPWTTSPLRKLVPYHSAEAVELPRAILRATGELARARNARALFVMTNFDQPCLVDESGTSRLERDLFSGLDLPHVRVDISPDQMIGFPKEVHPNERGHQAIADAIIAALKDHPLARP